jgi:tellurite resistance protein
MGLCGLSLAWHRAIPLMDDAAAAAALIAGTLASVVFVVLATASLWRARRFPQAWAEDRRHPVRHPFVAAVPVSMILLATVATALFGPGRIQQALWMLGCLLQLTATGWVLRRAWQARRAGGKHWVGVTPVLLIPIVGNVLAPLAGVPLGLEAWAGMQFMLGALLWPAVVVALVWRVRTHGVWAERLRPAAFILIAPPAVVGLGLLQLGAPPAAAWACWLLALGFAVWAAMQLPAIRQVPMGMPHWALSFPLAALAALTLRLAAPGGPLVLPAMALLAACTLVVAGLVLATVRGLRQGSLLVAEPVATLQVR